MTNKFRHYSGLDGAYDRSSDKPHFTGLVFRDGAFIQGAELNEAQSIARNRNQRISNLIARDGNRISGAAIIVDRGSNSVKLAAGNVYIRGDIRSVPDQTFLNIPMVGDVRIGVRLTAQIITEEDDPDLLGLTPGTISEGERGAAREIEHVSWGWDGDGASGDLYQVYLLKDGVAIDQSPPPSLSGIDAAIGRFDYGAHGNYIVSGCEVSALGLIGGSQIYSITAGEANINGHKRVRYHDLRHAEIESAETEEVEAEPRTFTGTGPCILAPYHSPIAAVLNVTVEKEATETVLHGPISGTQDPLSRGSIKTIIQVKQGSKIFVLNADYTLNADKVDWSLDGDEPATSSSYEVTYRYLDVVSPGTGYEYDASSITIHDGVNNGQIILRYTYKLPRIDALCLDAEGSPVYLKGLAARDNPLPPQVPTTLLKLADISNDWQALPGVTNSHTRSVPFVELWRYINLLIDQQRLNIRDRTKQAIDAREPTAVIGTFVDPFLDDRMRDAGIGQSAAIVDGLLMLAIDARSYEFNNPVTMLDYVEEHAIKQELATVCVKINPYQNFEPLPAQMQLEPAQDFWTVFRTQWTSPVTQQVVSRSSSELVNVVARSSEAIPFLRERPVKLTVKGFGAGENLISLTFDNINITPTPILVANSAGVIETNFTIPPMVMAGTKIVVAKGQGGSYASGNFTGQGTVVTTTLRRTILVPIPTPSSDSTSERSLGGDNADPQAQTFTLLEGRHICGIDFKFCARGNPDNHVLVELVKVRDGQPTRDVIAQAVVDMHNIVLDSWTTARFTFPPYLLPVEVAYVIKTDDAVHAISMARLGDFDALEQKRVSSQPYSIGVNADSSNASSWNFNQDRDLTFRVPVAKFSTYSKMVELGTITLEQCSDLMVLAGIDLPTAETSVNFEIERSNGQIYSLAAGQWLSLSEYLNETVKVRAILKGGEKASPTLYPGVTVVSGTLRNEGTYISRAFDTQGAATINAYLKAFIPAGSGLTVKIDKADGTFDDMSLVQNKPINLGWLDQKYTRPTPGSQSRLFIKLTGSPAARPQISDFGAGMI